MRAVFFVCSESSSLDVQTGRLSLFNIVDELTLVSFPAFIQSLCFTATMDKDPEDPNEAVLDFLMDLGDIKVAKFSASFDFQQRNRARTVNTIQGLMIPQPGSLLVRIQHGELLLAKLEIKINRIEISQNLLPLEQSFGNSKRVADPKKARPARRRSPR